MYWFKEECVMVLRRNNSIGENNYQKFVEIRYKMQF